MNYFASPKDSDRAMRFREAYGNATPGQNFMFEGQPYAGPEGLPPDQQVQQYQTPPGGWTGGVNPYDLAGQNKVTEVNSRPGDMSGPTYQQADDWNAQNYFSEYPINPLTGQPEYLTGDIWSQGIPTSGKGNTIDMYGKETTPNYAGTSIPFPDQSQREMAMAGYRVDDPSGPRFSSRHISDPSNIPSSVTGMSGPGQDAGQPPGLLADDMSGPRWTDGMKLRQEAERKRKLGLLEDVNQYTDKSGWEKDKKFSNIQDLLFQLGMNQMRDDSDPFGGEW